MKKIYHIILTILTIALLLLTTFVNINKSTNWADLSQYMHIINPVIAYGPIVLLCFFAFGNLFGSVVSKMLFVIVVILLIIFIITLVAPEFIAGILGGSAMLIP